MKKREIVAWTAGVFLMTGTLVGAGDRLQASQESADPVVSALARAIEGVWEPTVTIRDCQTGAPVVSFFAMESYIQGGSYIGESATVPVRRATGFGTWQHTGGRNFTALRQFFAYNPDGSPAGRLKISTNIRLSADGGSFRAADRAELSDLNGNVIRNDICSTQEATRLK
jgi:hypothetical protein